MKLFICLSFLLGFVTDVNSQAGYYFKEKKAVELRLPVDTALQSASKREASIFGLDDFTRDLLYFLNYCRQHPADFKRFAVVPYLLVYPEMKPGYGETLLVKLDSMVAIQSLKGDTRLFKIALAHSQDLAIHNRMSHSSSNGAGTGQRFASVGLFCGGECINMGSGMDALETLLSLLIDFGVPDFGHRKTLLDDKYRLIGAGYAITGADPIMRFTVIDLSCDDVPRETH